MVPGEAAAHRQKNLEVKGFRLCVCSVSATASEPLGLILHLKKQLRLGILEHGLGSHPDLNSGICHRLVLCSLTLSFLTCEMGIKPPPFTFVSQCNSLWVGGRQGGHTTQGTTTGVSWTLAIVLDTQNGVW